jgi:hypothetical protein
LRFVIDRHLAQEVTVDADTKKMFHPFVVWAEGLALWGKHFLPIMALSSMGLLLARIVRLSQPLWLSGPMTALNVGLSALYFVEVCASFVVSGLISLLIVHYFKNCRAGRVCFAEVFEAAKTGLFCYIRSIAVFVLLFFVASFLAAFALGLGESLFRASGGDRGMKTAFFIGSATVFVVIVISIFWYGFYFSLAPLVAALEKTGPWAAIVASRRRIRGSALRYLLPVGTYVVGYIGLGILVYRLLIKMGASRFAINMVDPVLFAVFGPLGLALWFLSYEKLTEIKNNKAGQ